jgi:2,4-dienoyl-CoA reductase-like NADH-dependent reductase (Old Yellow Enzyme family)
MPLLFEPFDLRSVRLRNRVVVSPMCQYSAVDGVPNDWHLVHLGSRAVGGAGLVIAEATAVEPAGRISPADTGIWNDEQAAAWSRIAAFITEQGSVPGIQLAHAGRKSSTAPPWIGGVVPPEEGGWSPVWSSSAVPFAEQSPTPVALDDEGLARVRKAFATATTRSFEAGFRLIEIHAAHGYLLHQFLSPLVNRRDDCYGGSLGNRMRFPLEVVSAVREAWPQDLPLIVRISATDWVEGGWDLAQSIEFAARCKSLGVDAIDCSSGGAVSGVSIPVASGYQTPFAEAIRHAAQMPTLAVGLITEARQAEEILAEGKADLVELARELLRDPYWTVRAARELGGQVQAPKQYLRAW